MALMMTFTFKNPKISSPANEIFATSSVYLAFTLQILGKIQKFIHVLAFTECDLSDGTIL